MAETWNFTSRNLSAGNYDDTSRTLEIEFQSGERYTYHDVPPDVWQDLKTASSPGRFFYDNIRDLYS